MKRILTTVLALCVLLGAMQTNAFGGSLADSFYERLQSSNSQSSSQEGGSQQETLTPQYDSPSLPQDSKAYYSKMAVLDDNNNVYASISDTMYIFNGSTVTEAAGGGTIGSKCLYGGNIYYINETNNSIYKMNISTLSRDAVKQFDTKIASFVIYKDIIYASDKGAVDIYSTSGDGTIIQSVSVNGGDLKTVYKKSENHNFYGWGISGGRLVILDGLQTKDAAGDLSTYVYVTNLDTGAEKSVKVVDQPGAINNFRLGQNYLYFNSLVYKWQPVSVNLNTYEVVENPSDSFYDIDELVSEYNYDGWDYYNYQNCIYRVKNGVAEEVISNNNSGNVQVSDINSSKMLVYKFDKENGKYVTTYLTCDPDGNNAVGIVKRYDNGVVEKFPSVSGSVSSSSSSGSQGSQSGICSKCGGTGWITCTVCHGTRGNYITMLGQRVWQGCVTCGQTGQMLCTECGGSGRT